MKINDNFVIDCINREKKRYLTHFTHMNGIDDETSKNNHRKNKQLKPQSTSSYGGSRELCAYPT